MSLDGAYEDNNIFARIIRGELPCAKIFEDDTTLAFLDIAPQSTGHALVVSKWSRARNILEVEPRAIGEVMATVTRVARALRGALNPDGIHVAQFNGGDTGQSVFHLHVHVVPRWGGDANFITIIGDSKVIPQLLRDSRRLLATEWDRQS